MKNVVTHQSYARSNLIQNLSTGLILTNPATARVIFFANPMSDAYNGLANLVS